MINLRSLVNIKYVNKRFYSIKRFDPINDVVRLRNFGIIAHIDAGKTTTTERMLFYSGLINQMGEVHNGNTVTDYMQQERNRGITIKSAAISFLWKNHQFNLIDTPGHIDFTMEVEQTLNVLDGAIVVLDASAGVEAQTLTVWRQAERYDIPKLFYVNKMDRYDANLDMCCKSIEEKLEAVPLKMQLPLTKRDKLIGVIDVLSLEKLIWEVGPKTRSYNKTALEESDGSDWIKAMEARAFLIDKLTEYDDHFANIVINSDSFDDVKSVDVVAAIKNCVSNQQSIVPVLCGSSYKNIGVQPLMDAVVLYLPSPNEREHHFKSFEKELSAKAFKILHDDQKGPLVFFRIYSGMFNKGQKIFNSSKNISEQSSKLYLAHADELLEVESLGEGNIAVVSGLKKTMSGDLVTSSQSALQNAKQVLEKKLGNKEMVDDFFNEQSKIPEPVFFCSIESPSLALQSAFEEALSELEREDPSLRVTHDSETGQTVLAGMGQLHIDIIQDRLYNEYKIEAELGPLQISYREAPVNQVKGDYNHKTKIGNNKQSVHVFLSIIPTEGEIKDVLILDKTADAASALANIHPKHLSAVKQGVEVGLSSGPKVGSKVVNTKIMLHSLLVGKGTTESMIAAATTQCIQKLLNQSGSTVLEPIMSVEVLTPDEHLPAVMADLSRRRANIQNVGMQGKNKCVFVEIPLAELMDYSMMLRTLTSGTASFNMEFIEHRIIPLVHEERTIQSIRGY